MEELIANEYDKVENGQAAARKLLQQTEEPTMDIWEGCKKPYDCGFFKYCSRHLPSPSVFDLYRMRFSDKLKSYRQGLVTYDDIKNERLTPVRRIQVDSGLSNTPHVEADKIKAFLDTLTYPLYFLDFETMQQVIPQFDGTKVYQQITFQYSLHIIEKEGGELIHKEHLGISGTDPRRALAEQLCQDIPMDVCTLAYNKSFECTRIKELAGWYPDLAEHLLNIMKNIKDLLDPFAAGQYYLPSMGGSFSIKRVLPSLFPDDPSLDYHNLEGGVQNGNDAMTIFPKIQFMEPKEQEAAPVVRQAVFVRDGLKNAAAVADESREAALHEIGAVRFAKGKAAAQKVGLAAAHAVAQGFGGVRASDAPSHALEGGKGLDKGVQGRRPQVSAWRIACRLQGAAGAFNHASLHAPARERERAGDAGHACADDDDPIQNDSFLKISR